MCDVFVFRCGSFDVCSYALYIVILKRRVGNLEKLAVPIFFGEWMSSLS